MIRKVYIPLTRSRTRVYLVEDDSYIDSYIIFNDRRFQSNILYKYKSELFRLENEAEADSVVLSNRS